MHEDKTWTLGKVVFPCSWFLFWESPSSLYTVIMYMHKKTQTLSDIEISHKCPMHSEISIRI